MIILRQFKVSTERHRKQWNKILGYKPMMGGTLTFDHHRYQQIRGKIEAIHPPVKELKSVGRPIGSMGKQNKKKSTISLHEEDWDKLDEIGPSRGLAVQKLLEDKDND